MASTGPTSLNGQPFVIRRFHHQFLVSCRRPWQNSSFPEDSENLLAPCAPNRRRDPTVALVPIDEAFSELSGERIRSSFANRLLNKTSRSGNSLIVSTAIDMMSTSPVTAAVRPSASLTR
jgi:hypothetical protein